MTKLRRFVAVAVLAFVTVLALGLDFSIELPYNWQIMLREGSISAVLNNLLIAMNHFYTMDRMNGTLVVIACAVIYGRYLFTGEFAGKKGEYILSAFLALTMLVSEAIVAEMTVTCLWAGGTQIIKTAVFMAGVWPLFLCAIRAMREGMSRLGKLPVSVLAERWWTKHAFGTSFLIMIVCWIPYLCMKYPIGMSPDATVQILDFQANAISKDHPIISTLIYGGLWKLGEILGDHNLGFFVLTLAQTVAMATVLAYSLVCMRRWSVPFVLRAAAMMAYCFVPNYTGWITTMVKDVPYVIGCILLTVLLIDFSVDRKNFFEQKKNTVLLVIALATVWLWRRNGPVMAIIVGGYLIIASGYAKRALALVMSSFVLCGTVQLGLETTMCKVPAAQRETYSLLVQSTARIIKEHKDELSEEELRVVSQVMDYEKAAENYNPIITDQVKRHFIESTEEGYYDEYVRVALSLIKRYPMDALDSFFGLTYRIFDLRSDRTEYTKAREISHPYYVRSYTNELYDQDALQGLNAAQEAVENWNYWYPELPGVGMLVNIGFCVDAMLILWYLAWEKKNGMLAGYLPGLVTLGFLMLSSIVYIRYALPITAALPLMVAANLVHKKEQTK